MILLFLKVLSQCKANLPELAPNCARQASAVARPSVIGETVEQLLQHHPAPVPAVSW